MAGMMMGKAGQLGAPSWALHVATDIVKTAYAANLQQEHAQAIADVRQGQGGCLPLPPVGFLDEA